ncbi:hypothetical protein QBC39DRAFT_346101 [Podospora conica]|nr:hypothetical protein QBC39DRAFT_346101 [Schizothecium conicum]
MVSLISILSAAVGMLMLANPVAALCKPAVGIEVYRDDWAYTIMCGRNPYNSPATTVTIYHDDRTTTSQTFPGTISFGHKTLPQAKIYE